MTVVRVAARSDCSTFAVVNVASPDRSSILSKKEAEPIGLG
jgi:hypothetical protein